MKQKSVTRKTILYFKKTWTLYLMMALPVAFAVVFRYLPMTNIAMAFKEYNMFKGVWASPWSEPMFKWFLKAFTTKDFWDALRNTLMLNSLDLVFGFPMPIFLAILLNELAFKRYKKITQTIVYLPHFLSWIIISGIAKQLLAPRSGIVNVMLNGMGLESIDFLTSPTLYVGTYIAFGLWKEMGWNTIIYLAAITGINPELYEAAEVDGASRWKKIWHITLPGIRSTIVVLLIMNLGRILGSEFDRPYSFSNSLVMSVADVLSTYVYRVGIRGFQFSLTAAVGLFQSVICVIFLFSANAIAKKFGERGVW
ncbi:MAG: putative rane protein [Herbinix sp.]|jgi:putative aldouronate transport system permease protein|nr:putative rane protein [Herbinix sp.]